MDDYRQINISRKCGWDGWKALVHTANASFPIVYHIPCACAKQVTDGGHYTAVKFYPKNVLRYFVEGIPANGENLGAPNKVL